MASNLRVDQITASTTGSVSIGTATFTGGLSGDITGLNVTGVITATTLNQNVTGVVTATGGFVVGTGATISGSTNTITASTNGSERVRIISSGHVGIGTDNPKAQTWRNGTALDVYGGAGNVVGNLHIGANRGDGVQTVGSIVFYDNTQDTNHKVISIIESDKTGSTTNQRGGTVSVYVKEDATVSSSAVESATFTKDGISFPSGNGIDFSAASGSAAGSTSALLDDYEEGTFTPTAGSPAVSGTGITYSGSYVKIGNVVWVQISLSAAPNSDIQVSTYAIIEGLPFNGSSDGASTSTVVTEDIDVFSRQGFIVKGNSNDRLFLSACGSSSGTSNLTMSIVYKTA